MKKGRKKQLFYLAVSAAGYGLIVWLINWTDMERMNIAINSGLGLFLFAAFFLGAQYIDDRLRKCHRREFLIGYGFILLFLTSEIVGYALQINATERGVEFTTLNCLILAAFILLFSIPFAVLFLQIKDREMILAGKTKMTWAKGISIWVGICLLWLPFFLAFYPGITGYDIASQWPQFESRAFDTNHPIIHTIFMGVIFEAGNFLWGNYNRGVALYTLFQLFVLAGSVSYGLYTIMSFRVSSLLKIMIAIYYICLPVYPILGVSTTKDVFFSAFFFVAFVEMIKYIESDRNNRKNCFFLIIFLTLSQLFRNNTVYGLILLEIFIVYLWIKMKDRRERKKTGALAGQIFLAIILYQAVYLGINVLVSASSGKVVEMLSVPCQQMARVYNEQGDQLSESEREALLSFFSEDGLKAYRWELSDSIKGDFNAEQFEKSPKEFFSLWISLGLKYPKVYVEATLYNTLPLWYTGDRTILKIKGGDYLEMDFKLDGFGLTKSHSLLPVWERICIQLCQKGKILNIPIISLLFIPAVYVWTIAAVFARMILLKRGLDCILPIFLLCYIATLFLGPCILPRYCMNFMLCTPILCLYYLHAGRNKIAEKAR